MEEDNRIICTPRPLNDVPVIQTHSQTLPPLALCQAQGEKGSLGMMSDKADFKLKVENILNKSNPHLYNISSLQTYSLRIKQDMSDYSN